MTNAGFHSFFLKWKDSLRKICEGKRILEVYSKDALNQNPDLSVKKIYPF